MGFLARCVWIAPHVTLALAFLDAIQEGAGRDRAASSVAVSAVAVSIPAAAPGRLPTAVAESVSFGCVAACSGMANSSGLGVGCRATFGGFATASKR